MNNTSTEFIMEKLRNAKTTEEGSKIIKEAVEVIPDKSFSCFFNEYLAQHQELSLPQIIAESSIARTYAYEVINGKKKGSKDRIIALCYCARMNDKDTSRALAYSKNNPLYPKINRDAHIIMALNLRSRGDSKFSSIYDFNNYLEENGYEGLKLSRDD